MIDLIGTLRHIYRRADQIFDFATATLRLTETGGSLTADGTEQTVAIIDTPLGSFKPLKVKIDTSNMDWGDTIVIRWYERIESGGSYIEKDEEEFDGPQDIAPLSPVKNIHLEPNRFGFRITLQQTVGTYRNYTWELLYEV